MSEQKWEAPIIELSRPLTAYLLWAVALDLRRWDETRQTKLSREEVVAFASFLETFLPEDQRTEIKPPPMLRAG